MLDGTIISGMRADFEADDKYELVYRDGRPSFFREQSPLLDWGEEKGGVICEPLYPSGIIITPAELNSMTMEDIDAPKVRALSETVSPVVLRGFCTTSNREVFVNKAHEFGEPLPWKFGLLLEVKDRGSESGGLNNVLSSEWMPFHFDGLFKTKAFTNDQGLEYLAPVPPK